MDSSRKNGKGHARAAQLRVHTTRPARVLRAFVQPALQLHVVQPFDRCQVQAPTLARRSMLDTTPTLTPAAARRLPYAPPQRPSRSQSRTLLITSRSIGLRASSLESASAEGTQLVTPPSIPPFKSR